MTKPEPGPGPHSDVANPPPAAERGSGPTARTVANENGTGYHIEFGPEPGVRPLLEEMLGPELDAVERMLQNAQSKDGEWLQRDAQYHRMHAVDHIVAAAGDPIDDDNEPHEAHAAGRCLMALA